MIPVIREVCMLGVQKGHKKLLAISGRKIALDKTVPSKSIFPELLVFDFDCTITSVPVCVGNMRLISAESTLENIIADLDFFRSFVLEYRAAGGKVGIASYGEKTIILDIMNRIFPFEQVFSEKNVLTCSDFPGHSPVSKATMIKRMASQLHCRTQNLVLIDDNQDHVRDVEAAGYIGVFIPTWSWMFPLYCSGFNRNCISLFHQRGLRISK